MSSSFFLVRITCVFFAITVIFSYKDQVYLHLIFVVNQCTISDRFDDIRT